MNTMTSSSGMTLDKEELKKMTRQVKETLATEYVYQRKAFSASDLWNIQRRKRNINLRKASL